MTVGIVSTGHMGAGLGWSLHSGGARVVTTLVGRSARTARLAADAGIEPLSDLDDVVIESQVILVVTPPAAAVAVAAEIAAAAGRTGAAPVVADLNAIAPSTMLRVAATLEAAALPVVDGAISGPPPTVRGGARIYLCGPAAADVAALPWHGVSPLLLVGPVGQASAVKMCTASVYKGVGGLLAQAMRAAAHYGVLDPVMADLSGGIGTADPDAVVAAASKAERFVPELREIATAQREAGLTASLFEAFARVFADIARSELATADPESLELGLPADEVARLLSTRRRR